MQFDGFEEPYTEIDEIEEGAGIYIVCSCQKVKVGKNEIIDTRRCRVIDIGESGWNIERMGQGVKRRLKGHNRKNCWEENKGKALLHIL